MTIIVNPEKRFRYVAAADRDLPDGDPNKPVFLLKPPTGKDADEIFYEAMEIGLHKATDEDLSNLDAGSKYAKVLLRCAAKGVAGWENLYDQDLEPISPDLVVGVLGFPLRMELGGEVYRMLMIGPEEAKN